MTQPTITLPPTTATPVSTPPSWGFPTPPAPPAQRKTGPYVWAAIGIFILGAAVVSAAGGKKDAASTGSSSTGGSSLSTWTYGQSDSKALGDDLGSMSTAASAGDVSGMLSSCRAFQRHLATAEGHLPTPNASLTAELENSYGYFDQAATACIDGATNLDTAAITRMGTYIELGGASIVRATAILHSL